MDSERPAIISIRTGDPQLCCILDAFRGFLPTPDGGRMSDSEGALPEPVELILTICDQNGRVAGVFCAVLFGQQSEMTRCAPEQNGCSLSPHETRLLSMLVNGHNLTTAAAKLGVSRATVAWHMRNVYEKMQVHSKSEAVAKALRAGLLQW